MTSDVWAQQSSLHPDAYVIGFNPTPRLGFIPFGGPCAQNTASGTGQLLTVNVPFLVPAASNCRPSSTCKRKANQDGNGTSVKRARGTNSVTLAVGSLSQRHTKPAAPLAYIPSTNPPDAFAASPFSILKPVTCIDNSPAGPAPYQDVRVQYGMQHAGAATVGVPQTRDDPFKHVRVCGPTIPSVTFRYCGDLEHDIECVENMDWVLLCAGKRRSTASGVFTMLKDFVSERLAGACVYLPFPLHVLDPAQAPSTHVLLPVCTAGTLPHVVFSQMHQHDAIDVFQLSFLTLRVALLLLRIVAVARSLTLLCVDRPSAETEGLTQVHVPCSELSDTFFVCQQALQTKGSAMDASTLPDAALQRPYSQISNILHACMSNQDMACAHDPAATYRPVVWTCPCCSAPSGYEIRRDNGLLSKQLQIVYDLLVRILRVPVSVLHWHQAWSTQHTSERKAAWIRIPYVVHSASQLILSMGLGELHDDDRWKVAYHGTTYSALKQILTNGIRPPSVPVLGGKRKLNGSVSGSHRYVYLSPSLTYATLYSTPTVFKIEGDDVHTHIVLECRCRHNSFRVATETIGATGKRITIDPNIPNSKLEWYTQEFDSVFITALWVFTGTEHPFKELRSKFK